MPESGLHLHPLIFLVRPLVFWIQLFEALVWQSHVKFHLRAELTGDVSVARILIAFGYLVALSDYLRLLDVVPCYEYHYEHDGEDGNNGDESESHVNPSLNWLGRFLCSFF